ncbi:MAG: hypothetical protein EON95_16495 [Caulobacteraceae bacterium]|nr:MAG: hypothetical protein EON95_16495 [Caulobacteraceae bacterium]
MARTGVILAAWLAALMAGPALAQVSAKPDSVALTIYQDPNGGRGYYDGRSGLALVTEWRTIEIPAGQSRITFRGVAAGIVPATAALDGLPATMVERNQDYNLMSPGSIIAAAIGEPVKLVRTNRVTGVETVRQAVLRSGPNGVIMEVDGGFEALGCSGEPERLVFDKVPDKLSPEPTLSMTVRARAAGTYRVRLTYLAVGLNWKANYVATVRPDGRSLDLTGWITLSNDSATTFTDAPTQVVAGDVARSPKTRATVAQGQAKRPACWPTGLNFAYQEIVVTGNRVQRREMDGVMAMAPPAPPPPPAPVQDAPIAEQSELGDYKLYTLPYPTTVAARQTKQLLMLDADGVAFDRVYRFTSWAGETWNPDVERRPVALMLRMKNRKEAGLGLPLPGGNAMIGQETAGGRLLAGEFRFENSAVGAPFDLVLQESRQVEVRPTLVSKKAKGRNKRDTEYVYSVEAVNNTEAPASFEVRLVDYGRLAKVTRSTVKFIPRDGGRVMPFVLAAGERRTVGYTVVVRQ